MSQSDLPQSPTDAPWWPPAGERYVSRRELAGMMGVSLATVDRMVAEGMPSVTWGRRTRRFSASQAISWAAERGREA
jgi:phage terminase Nu1 subunit (DNA packaging protein)